MKIRCPKCSSASLIVYEYFEIAGYTQFENGVVVSTGSDGGNGGSTNRFSATCAACDHDWRIRYRTGQRVIEASQNFREVTQ